jgi:hypothetical protein
MRADFIDFCGCPLCIQKISGHAFKLISDSQNVASLLDPVRFMEQNGTPDELQSSRPHGDKVADYRHL